MDAEATARAIAADLAPALAELGVSGTVDRPGALILGKEPYRPRDAITGHPAYVAAVAEGVEPAAVGGACLYNLWLSLLPPTAIQNRFNPLQPPQRPTP